MDKNNQLQLSAELRWGKELPVCTEYEALDELQSRSGGLGEAEVST